VLTNLTKLVLSNSLFFFFPAANNLVSKLSIAGLAAK